MRMQTGHTLVFLEAQIMTAIVLQHTTIAQRYTFTDTIKEQHHITSHSVLELQNISMKAI